MFLPSGRVHAIGSGLVIFEIQQNSDTTYRVFDWNRPGLDGKPRELHIPQSLASIDFSDEEPSLAGRDPLDEGPFTRQKLVEHPLFMVELYRARMPVVPPLPRDRACIVAIVGGTASISGGGESVDLAAGQFCLVPASTNSALTLTGASVALVTGAG
jgi:mannose-6-phosphate isomerase